MKVLELLEKIEQVVQKKEYQTYIESDVSILKHEYSIESAEEIQKDLERLEDENRLLKIGIVGRVKAGKSSLINAILFDGKDILPKAATPMTAALTEISYGESLQAEVEFFSQKDIENIKQDYDKYLEHVQKEKQDFKNKIFKNLLKKLSGSEIKEKAEKKAHSSVKEKFKQESASYDQYKRMKSSGILSSSIPETKSLEGQDMEDLKKQLKDYVGSEGKYMPFTKAVHLKINEENLKDIEVVDTPGLNDPVVSREERTHQMLKKCEVTFVVSPAGQFLSSEDTSLMDRISTKEGISEIYVVASQVDNQLYGNDKEKGNGKLPQVLDSITDTLGKQLVGTLTTLKKDRPVIGNLFDQLIQQGKEKILYSSGICETIRQNFDHLNILDEPTLHAWNNLKDGYPHAFSDRDRTTSLANLDLLANTEKIKEVLEKVRNEKDKILQEKKDKTLKDKENSIQEYHQKLIESVQEKLENLQNTDQKKIEEQIKNVENMKDTFESKINNTFHEDLDNFIYNIDKESGKIIEDKFNEKKRKVNESKSSKTAYKEERYGFLWLSERTVKDYDYKEVRAGDIRDSLVEFQDEVKDQIENNFKDKFHKWKDTCREELIKKLQNLSEKEVKANYINIGVFKKSLRNVFYEIPEPDIKRIELPEELNSHRTLKGDEAEEYWKKAESYSDDLNRKLKDSLKEDIKSLKDFLKKVKLTDNVFSGYKEDLKVLQEKLENKKKSEKEMNQFIEDLKDVYHG